MKSCCYKTTCECDNINEDFKIDQEVYWSGNSGKSYKIAKFGTFGESNTACIYDGNGASHWVLLQKLKKKVK